MNQKPKIKQKLRTTEVVDLRRLVRLSWESFSVLVNMFNPLSWLHKYRGLRAPDSHQIKFAPYHEPRFLSSGFDLAQSPDTCSIRTELMNLGHVLDKPCINVQEANRCVREIFRWVSSLDGQSFQSNAQDQS